MNSNATIELETNSNYNEWFNSNYLGRTFTLPYFTRCISEYQEFNSTIFKLPEENKEINEIVKMLERLEIDDKKSINNNIPESDVDLVIAQTNVSRYKAYVALVKYKGDIVNAIVELTD